MQAIMTINNSSKVPASQAYFPVMLHFGINSGVTSTTPGVDTRAILATPWQNIEVLADGTQCFVEVEQWTSNNAILWVRVPNLAYNTTLVLNTLSSPNTQYVGEIGSVAAQTVWSNDFVAVYHMAQDLYNAPYKLIDSTVNHHDGTPKVYLDPRAGQTYRQSFPSEIFMYPWPDLVHPGGYPGSRGSPGYPELVEGIAGGYAEYFDSVTRHCSFNMINLGNDPDFSRDTHPKKQLHYSWWMNHGHGLYTTNHMDYPNVQNPNAKTDANGNIKYNRLGNRVRFIYKTINHDTGEGQAEILIPVQNYWYNTEGGVEGAPSVYAYMTPDHYNDWGSPSLGRAGYGCVAQPQNYLPGNWHFHNAAFGTNSEGHYHYADIPPWWNADGWGSGTVWNEDGQTITGVEGKPPAEPNPWIYTKRAGKADRANGRGYYYGELDIQHPETEGYANWWRGTGDLVIGSAGWLSNWTGYTGSVDELRISRVVRSEPWIITDYWSNLDKLFTYAFSGGTPLPLADFTAIPVLGQAPLAVQFTDKSQNATSWLWDFGD